MWKERKEHGKIKEWKRKEQELSMTVKKYKNITYEIKIFLLLYFFCLMFSDDSNCIKKKTLDGNWAFVVFVSSFSPPLFLLLLNTLFLTTSSDPYLALIRVLFIWSSFKNWTLLSLLTNFLSLQWVPDVAVEVIVAGKDKAAWAGESQGRDAGVQAGVLVVDHLLVGAQVVHLAGAVVGACDDGVSTGEELRRREISMFGYYWAMQQCEWERLMWKPWASTQDGI